MKIHFAVLCLLIAAMFGCAATARAASGSVQVFNTIHVPADGQVGDAVCIFCSIQMEGKATGDVVAIFGNVHLDGDAQHDVVSIFGNLRAERDSSIEGDVVGVFSSIRLGENVTVGQDLTSILCSLHEAGSVRIGGDRTVIPGIVFYLPSGLLLLFVILIVREVRTQRMRREMRGIPMPPRQ
jgi:hypothetical protein